MRGTCRVNKIIAKEGVAMQIIVDVAILCDDPGYYSNVGKEYETELVPMVGMELEDPAWEEARKIKSVIINPEDGYYYVNVGDDTCRDKIQCERLMKMYHSHGWTRFIPKS
jgi:hypothetical protein